MKKIHMIYKIFLFIFSFGIICYIGLYTYAKFTPTLDINSANSFYLYDINNELYSGSNDEWVSLENISDDLINATLSIEDKNFYKHQGFDYLRIIKALYTNIKNRKTLQGASTISQQYTKNLFLDFDKTWERKINEAWLTIRLESHYSKDEILEGYLNSINYGGIFGIENASHYYFGKNSNELSLGEASILAGIPKSPSNYSPITNFEAAKRRQKIILDAMVKNKYITEIEALNAYNEELILIGKLEKSSLSTLMYYEDAVIKELKSINSIPSSFLNTGGLKIYTNLNMDIQKTMEDNINKYLTDDKLQVSSVIIEPITGKILALAGGRDYSKSQYNRVTSSKRQVGSTLKPFLYYSALENGFTSSTTFTSAKTTFTFSEGKTYSPENYGDYYPNKEITMAAALSYSDNIYAVKTHLFLGEEVLVETASRVGINGLSPLPSLALGSEEINMLDMIQGYSVLATGGTKIKPHLINKVEDINGNVLYEYKEESEKVLNTSIVYILNEMMRNCYSGDMIDYTYPTCISIASKIKHDYAIKTGTTDTDNLIFGYNNQLLMGIWSGYDDNSLTDGNVSNQIKNIWVDTMESHMNDELDEWYTMPNNVVGVLVDPISGNLATSTKKKMFYYIKGTEPYIDYNLEDTIPTMKEEKNE